MDSSLLTTARHCSQVCRQWRSIFLSSSLIWGRLIDVNGLKWTTDKWRKEIFARTGEAVLWVFGVADQDVWDFLSPFLQQNWRIVQILAILNVDKPSKTSLALQQKRWAFMKEPAPQLRRIEIQESSSISGLPTASFFADDAPLLEDFSIQWRHKFPTNTSWLSNLSSVTFSSSFTMDEVLMALPRMPRLIYLSVSMDRDTPPQKEPKVVLPNLRMLYTEGDRQSICILLQCITPSPDCCLAMRRFLESRPAEDNGENPQFENAVKSYIMPYFALHPPSALTFSIGGGVLVLQDYISWDPRNPWVRCFCIVLDIPDPLPSSILIKELCRSPWVPYITKFDLDAHGHPEYPDGLNNVAVISALDALSSSATTLDTNIDTLRELLERPLSYTSTLFPNLTTLNLDSELRYPPVPVEGEPPHHEFLKLRKAIGRPVSVLDLGFSRTSQLIWTTSKSTLAYW
ncbi:hypothetical protein CPC08DRAFT_717694 [Agrocybe pediades]|nr:hypothetical protein CPC08DRAFT_717694 [Agrocybe pediades]